MPDKYRLSYGRPIESTLTCGLSLLYKFIFSVMDLTYYQTGVFPFQNLQYTYWSLTSDQSSLFPRAGSQMVFWFSSNQWLSCCVETTTRLSLASSLHPAPNSKKLLLNPSIALFTSSYSTSRLLIFLCLTLQVGHTLGPALPKPAISGARHK